MSKLVFIAAIAIVSLYGYSASQGAFAQEATAAAEPSKQAVCGYQWRQYKAANPSAPHDRAAWVNFMHTACGMTGKVRNDDAIKTYLDAHPDKRVNPDWHGALPGAILARGKKKLIDDSSEG